MLDNHIHLISEPEGASIIGKITFRYHNPNTDDETLKHISKIFVEVSRVKFESILQEVAAPTNANEDTRESSAN